MSQIIVILQLVLALLSNPATAQNAQVQALAAEAIGEATQALAPVATASSTVTYAVPTSTDNTQPIVINVTNQNLGTAPQQVDTPPVIPVAPASCTLIIKTTCEDVSAPNCSGNPHTERDGDYSWTSTGIPTSTTGQIYWDFTDGSGHPYSKLIGPMITQSQGEELVFYPNGPAFQQMSANFRLTLGGTTCTFSYQGVNPDGSPFVPQ